MSLHALADHMAARGRGPDTTLVHMAPQEVAGLQALALAHGGSLTINPDTGLPEAGFLKKLLPALAGFALNAFAPGFGSAIGAALGGLGSAAGTAIGLGGITGLATGNLQKGLMAGLGAYGGASLAGGVMGAGVGAAAQEGANLASSLTDAQAQSLGFQNAATAPAANAAAASNFDKLGAGFNAITKDPSAFGSFAKQNAGSLLAATSPLLADQGVQTVTKLDNPGYIRNFDYDPMTQTARALNPVRVRDLGYADGGSIGAPKTVTQMPGTSPYRDSQAAYEYLMGIAPKEPQQNTQTQTQTSINPAAEGRYSWDSDKKAYTWIPSNGVTETTPTPAPALNYEFGGGDSGSGAGGGSGGVGTAGAGVSASDSADFGDTSSSNSDSSSDSGDGGVSGGGGGGAADSGGTGDGDGGGCVDPAVLITLANGEYIPAGRVKVGDVIFAMHEKTLEFGAYPVEYVEELPQPKALVLFGDGSDMLVSHSHKFFMVDGKWKQTYQLEAGDTVKAAPGVTDKTVVGLEPKGDGPVMKFTVTDAHTYISDGLISHNSKAKGGVVRQMAGGGLSHLYKKFAEGGTPRDGSSQAAYNYLMGLTNSTRPDAPAYTPQSVYMPQPTTPTTPAAPTTGGGGGGGASPIIGGGLTTLPTTTTTPVMPSPDSDFPSTYPQPVMPSPDSDFPSTYPQPTVPNSDDFRTASDIDAATISVDNPYAGMDDSARATDIDNATIAVDVPNTGVTAMDDGTTQVVMDQIAQQQPAAQATVQDEPNGGATVTLPESPYVPADVADTFDPDTGSYVEVGNAGGDFGDTGYEQSDDFGKYGLGVSDFGGGGGGGGKYFDDLSSQMFAANGGLMSPRYAMGGGLGSLGGYSDGGRLLRGPGDGVSDSIPAMIGKKQPARLADGEFVVPARIVSELGNGSTEAGARKLYKMMDRIQAARGKTVGKGRVAKNSRAEKHLPA